MACFLERDLEEKGAAYLRRRYCLDLASDDPSFEELVDAAKGWC